MTHPKATSLINLARWERLVAEPRSALTCTIVLALSGCASGGDAADPSPDRPTGVERVDGVPVLAGSTTGPGRVLADGFTVAAGSHLLGGIAPLVEPGATASSTPTPGTCSGGPGAAPSCEPGSPPTPGGAADPVVVGWVAQLLVTGDPASVVAAYGRQAIDHGYRPINAVRQGFPCGSTTPQRCVVPPPDQGLSATGYQLCNSDETSTFCRVDLQDPERISETVVIELIGRARTGRPTRCCAWPGTYRNRVRRNQVSCGRRSIGRWRPVRRRYPCPRRGPIRPKPVSRLPPSLGTVRW